MFCNHFQAGRFKPIERRWIAPSGQKRRLYQRLPSSAAATAAAVVASVRPSTAALDEPILVLLSFATIITAPRGPIAAPVSPPVASGARAVNDDLCCSRR